MGGIINSKKIKAAPEILHFRSCFKRDGNLNYKVKSEISNLKIVRIRNSFFLSNIKMIKGKKQLRKHYISGAVLKEGEKFLNFMCASVLRFVCQKKLSLYTAFSSPALTPS